ncbi:M28 family peptidase [Hymenobacter glacieicola]|uniref:Glutamine cyclotransferase n=1 Tax=Hymenobacter glacieicola TaxID=1562124 RepID=A0ABQ1WFT1_9BACT|nr:M28 family peptidase [Hymenobacter glacieicola]GGG28418.1 glutamine cyclotransferase [Hymenobacter glacieicola]
MNLSLSRLAPASLVALLLLTACPAKKDTAETENNAASQPALPQAPAFNPDSAYAYTAKQVAFGPRVPNTKAHVQTGDWIIGQFKAAGLTVKEQPFEAMAFDGKMLKSRNIIAQYMPQAPRRIAIFTHWDTRPFADKDKEKKNAPLDGASDGASGVGIALEIARVLSQQKDAAAPGVGVDFILFDSEDYGYDGSTQGEKKNLLGQQESWCLGSQHWAKNMVPANYKPNYGILLDMVGAKNGRFSREDLSRQQARDVVDKVWNTAAQLGYSDYFLFSDSPGITDDHVFTNQAGVRTIDIIDFLPSGEFQPYHHTTQDNMSIIDKRTLKAVGQTLLTTIYAE